MKANNEWNIRSHGPGVWWVNILDYGKAFLGGRRVEKFSKFFVKNLGKTTIFMQMFENINQNFAISKYFKKFLEFFAKIWAKI